MSENYIAAIELGSSKIRGAAGAFNPETKTLRVLAVAQEDSNDAIRYGLIQNPDEVATRVTRIIEQLNSNDAIAPRKITGVFVGLAGRSMRSVTNEVQIYFPEETEIDGEMLDKLRNDAKEVAMDSNQEILAIIPCSYHIDGLETSAPRGAMGKTITGVYDIIIGRSELKRNLRRAIGEKAGLQIEGLLITEVATADLVLTNDEKRLGCMLVDFGAETTSVSIYQKGSLCYYSTIPLGSRNITRDLTTLSILEEKAEEIKCDCGRAVPRETPSTLNLNLNGIKLSDVSNLVVARAEEIVANVVQQISYAELTTKDLPAGIVCVGAGSNLNGILELLENQTNLNARKGTLPPFVQAEDAKAKRIELIQSAALLYAGGLTGNDKCMETPLPDVEDVDDTEQEDDNPQPEPKPDGKVGGFFNRLSSKFSNMFASPVDDESELE